MSLGKGDPSYNYPGKKISAAKWELGRSQRPLMQQHKKLRKNPKPLLLYTKIMKKQLENGVIEIPPKQTTVTARTYYMCFRW